MVPFVVGLALFLGLHSVRIFADGWRTRVRDRLGPNAWRGLYSLVSIVGFGLLVWGYGLARRESSSLFFPPVWTAHLAGLLMVPVFVLLAAVYVKGTRIKAKIGHPMIAAVKVWALGHLLANGRVVDVILFGSFLAWAVLCFRASRRRDRAAGVKYEPGPASRDLVAVVVGVVLWAVFAFALHVRLIGVAPFAFTL